MDLFKKERNLSKRNGGMKKGNAMSTKKGIAMFKNLSSKSISLLWWIESDNREIEDMRIYGLIFVRVLITCLSLKFQREEGGSFGYSWKLKTETENWKIL